MDNFFRVLLLVIAAPLAVNASGKILRKERIELSPTDDNQKSNARQEQVAEPLEFWKRRTVSVENHELRSKLPRCGMQDYASGTWEKVLSQSRRSFVCCSGDGDGGGGSSTYCGKRNSTFKKGVFAKWSLIQESTVTGEWPYFKFLDAGGHACSCDDTPSNPDQELAFEQYDWTPSACSLDDFDAEDFCRVLHGRTLAVVGDSTAAQDGTSLVNMIVASLGKDATSISCAKDITVVASDTLVGLKDDRTPESKWHSAMGNMSRWHNSSLASSSLTEFLVNEIETAPYDLVVLGCGPHIHEVDTYKGILAQVSDAIKQRRSKPGAPTFLWKTTDGGGCGKINHIPDPQDTHAMPWKYWQLFSQYDELAKDTMKELESDVVDMSMLHLRGDARTPDCLHLCLPGPDDVFARILSHVLRLREQAT